MPKILNTAALIHFNGEAVRRDYNRAVTDEFLEELDPEGWHLVVMNMLHEYEFKGQPPAVRCQIMCKMADTMAPEMVFLDIPLDDFNELKDQSEMMSVKQ